MNLINQSCLIQYIMFYKFNCIICTEKTQFTTKCRCQICLLCLLNWFEEKNKDKRIEIINCPNKDCLYTYSRDEILSYCSY